MRLSHLLFFPVAIWCCAPLAARPQSTQQIKIVSPKMTNGGMSFGLSAPLGRTYFINAGTNLAAWTPVSTNVVGDSALFVDANAAHLRQRSFNAAYSWAIMMPN